MHRHDAHVSARTYTHVHERQQQQQRENNNKTKGEREMEEQWKPIAGYEGLYEVSNLGRVKSIARLVPYPNGKGHNYPERIRRINTDRAGYKYVDLWKDGKGRSAKVHRLVAQTFIPNPSHLPEVNHINEDKTDNRAENLEWCTAEYNSNFGTRKERATAKTKRAVLQFTKDGKLIAEYASAREAAKQFRNPHIAMQIGECCRGTQKTAHGYKWSFKDERILYRH